ncbi:hypothetical protein GCM10010201_28600 [Pilimelia columellifera subsp. columellifera]|uniref:Phosphoglycerate mutase n=1 Tax=Pilimelia columellifera subsp. columellifera TaxID=706583 RepID=A0ABN3NP16_9ACTN
MWLVCHAPTAAVRRAVCGGGDEHLDEGGRAAALIALAPRAGRSPFGRPGLVVSSPALAARQTVELAGLEAEVTPALRDLDLGRWRGLSWPQVIEADPDGAAAWLGDPDAAPHGGESVRAAGRRVADWLGGTDELLGPVVAVTHPTVVRLAVVHALGLPVTAWTRLDAAPLSITRLSRGTSGWRLLLTAGER